MHAGLLRVTGDPATGLEWRARGSELRWSLDTELSELAQLPVVQVHSARTERGEDPLTDKEDSAASYSHLASSLTSLGYTAAQARERISSGVASLLERGSELSEDSIIREALCSRPS